MLPAIFLHRRLDLLAASDASNPSAEATCGGNHCDFSFGQHSLQRWCLAFGGSLAPIHGGLISGWEHIGLPCPLSLL
jgi:hypothetical protein